MHVGREIKRKGKKTWGKKGEMSKEQKSDVGVYERDV